MLDGKGLVLPIMREEAKRAGYTFEQLISDDRQYRITAVRQYAMWRARKETGRSWWAIARFFQRDHTTVMHGYRKVEELPPDVRGVFPPYLERVAHKKRSKDWGKKYQAKPCRKGHDGMRYVSTGRCVQCKLIRDRKRDRKAQFYAEAAE